VLAPAATATAAQRVVDAVHPSQRQQTGNLKRREDTEDSRIRKTTRTKAGLGRFGRKPDSEAPGGDSPLTWPNRRHSYSHPGRRASDPSRAGEPTVTGQLPRDSSPAVAKLTGPPGPSPRPPPTLEGRGGHWRCCGCGEPPPPRPTRRPAAAALAAAIRLTAGREGRGFGRSRRANVIQVDCGASSHHRLMACSCCSARAETAAAASAGAGGVCHHGWDGSCPPTRRRHAAADAAESR
jgi:hypothetical protein